MEQENTAQRLSTRTVLERLRSNNPRTTGGFSLVKPVPTSGIESAYPDGVRLHFPQGTSGF